MTDVQTIVSDFVLLFAVIDPIGTVPIFISATRGQSESDRCRFAMGGIGTMSALSAIS
jgi:small neutral amino acid transporter SnatA (MarC family)